MACCRVFLSSIRGLNLPMEYIYTQDMENAGVVVSSEFSMCI